MPGVEAHLQMIQGVITRLAAHSTTAKGWSITLSGALLGYSVTSRAPLLGMLAVYSVLAFAALDTYYLALERAYRVLYDQAARGAVNPWDMRITRPGPREVFTAARGPANLLLYGATVLVAGVLSLYLALT